jgi:hypothetical protein
MGDVQSPAMHTVCSVHCWLNHPVPDPLHTCLVVADAHSVSPGLQMIGTHPSAMHTDSLSQSQPACTSSESIDIWSSWVSVISGTDDASFGFHFVSVFCASVSSSSAWMPSSSTLVASIAMLVGVASLSHPSVSTELKKRPLSRGNARVLNVPFVGRLYTHLVADWVFRTPRCYMHSQTREATAQPLRVPWGNLV